MAFRMAKFLPTEYFFQIFKILKLDYYNALIPTNFPKTYKKFEIFSSRQFLQLKEFHKIQRPFTCQSEFSYSHLKKAPWKLQLNFEKKNNKLLTGGYKTSGQIKLATPRP